MTSTDILLVEDNPDDEALTLRAFRKSNLGNSIVVARDGAEALDYLFSDENELPRLVLLDWKLPKLSGEDVLKRIRADMRTKLLPVVILTSSKEQEDLVTSYSLGANSYIRKPVDSSSFFEAIQKVGLYWVVLNELPEGL